MKYILKDKFSGLSHLAGALVGIVVLVVFVSRASASGDPWRIISSVIFGSALILLYSSSAVYHLSPVSPEAKKILRRIDHTMIFVFIAGSYTPYCLVTLRGTWGWIIFGIVWSLTIAGFFVKLFWLHAGRWLSTALYLIMGWVAIIAAYPLVKSLPAAGSFWLLARGIFYSVGAVVYALKRPDPIPNVFGFHEIWHVFVLLGSFSHVLSVATVL